MSELPIIFNTEMVKAILSGNKVCTRRPIKFELNEIHKWGIPAKLLGDWGLSIIHSFDGKVLKYEYQTDVDDSRNAEVKPPYQIGDLLYVRETWNNTYRTNGDPVYLASWFNGDGKVEEYDSPIKWKPSLHMPKEFARIWLKVTSVRVERVNDITEEGSMREGMKATYRASDTKSARKRFNELWSSLYNNWDSNPWVWVIDFEVVNK